MAVSRTWRPRFDFVVPYQLLNPTSSMKLGKLQKEYPDTTAEDYEPTIFFGNWRVWGGAERIQNGVIIVDNTSQIETWYRPDIHADSRIITPDGDIWEVIARPENIEFRNQYMRIKLRLWAGGG